MQYTSLLSQGAPRQTGGAIAVRSTKQPCDSGRIYCLPVLSRVGYRFLSFDLLKEEISMAFSDFQSIEQVLAQYPLEVRQASFLSEIEAALPELLLENLRFLLTMKAVEENKAFFTEGFIFPLLQQAWK